MNKIHLSVIIPAFNEEKRLSRTLLAVDKYLREQKYGYEIIVVNDGSTDNTAGITKKFSYLIKNLKLIDNKKNHGKGWVVRQGMLESEGEIRLFTDADNSTSIDQFNKMIPFFPAKGGSASGGKKGYDVVIGSRDIKGAELGPPPPWHKRGAGAGGN